MRFERLRNAWDRAKKTTPDPWGLQNLQAAGTPWYDDLGLPLQNLQFVAPIAGAVAAGLIASNGKKITEEILHPFHHQQQLQNLQFHATNAGFPQFV